MIKISLTILTFSVLFLGCSNQLVKVGESHPNTELLSSNESAIIFYRMNGDEDFVPTIRIDKRIVGSLLPNHFAQTRVCEGKSNIGLINEYQGIQILEDDIPIVFNGLTNVYLKINETDEGHFTLTEVDDITAQKDLKQLNAESHIINRHVPDCKKISPAPEPIVLIKESDPVVLQRFNLSSDALFAFGKSQFKDILPKGRKELDALAQKILSNSIDVEQLKVSGHTDRLGTDTFNMKLSQARAQTVADYLRKKGIKIRIEAVGYGSSDPVTTWCKGPRSASLIECLQPDRRVNIDLIGQKSILK